MTTNFSGKRFGEPAWIWMYIVAAAGFSLFKNVSFLILTGKKMLYSALCHCVV
jgi:hypothetical protein